MSKAEERALEKYPANKTVFDKYEKQRYAYICGYIQAEKDLELTWEDMSSLKMLLDEVENEFKKGQHKDKDYIGYCKEVLKRFNKERKEK